MGDLCKAFQTQARRVSRLLSKGNFGGVRLAEETLTNLLLLDLASQRSAEFDIRGYSKGDEAILGADWEMWIGGASGLWLPCRVQAKVLNPSTISFDHLHYRKDATSPYQCDTLIAAARRASPRRFPLYVLYARVPFGTASQYWPCGSLPRRNDLFGCSIVTATQVRTLRLQGLRHHLTDLLPGMRPWHCLVCCRGFGGADLAERAASWIASLSFPVPTGDRDFFQAADGFDINDDLPRLAGDTPQYVAALLDNRTPELPPDIGGLLVIREVAPTG